MNRIKKLNDFQLLYLVNKLAKRERDIQQRMADMIYGDDTYIDITSTHHDILHDAKNKKQQLYKIKNQLLYNLLKNKKVEANLISWISEDGQPEPTIEFKPKDKKLKNKYTYHLPLFGFRFKDDFNSDSLKEIDTEVTSDIDYELAGLSDDNFIKKCLENNDYYKLDQLSARMIRFILEYYYDYDYITLNNFLELLPEIENDIVEKSYDDDNYDYDYDYEEDESYCYSY